MSISPRYSRQSILPEIGAGGQQRLGAARLLCVGAGGLGCAALPYLAGAGIGHITIIDPDQIELGNLQRQVLFSTEDIGQPKAAAAARRLRGLNPEIRITPLQQRLEGGNVETLLRDHDVVLDGSDNYATKYLLGDACVKYGVPLVYGSVTGMEAMITVLDSRHGPCLRCLFPRPPTRWVPNCAEAGVLGPLVGLAGCLQASEAIKLLVDNTRHGVLKSLAGRLWVIDARDMSSRQLQVPRREDCPLCQQAPEEIVLPAAPEAATEEMPAETAAALDDALFIDVREVDEYRQGHIPGALNLPLSDLDDAPGSLPQAVHYVVYCAQGPRARAAAALLQQHGVTGLVCLRGGMAQWDGEVETGVSR